MSEKMVGIISKGLMYAVAGIGLLFVMLTYLNWDSVSMNRAEIDGYVGAAMYVCYIGFIAAALFGILFGVYHFFTNFGKSKGALVGMAIFVGVIFVSYLLASDEVLRAYSMGGTEPPSPETVKFSGTGIIAVYIFGILTVGAAVFSEIARLFK